jgi:predicted RNA-binding Zn-ribbon protein involved in translation (DUF1610 family)
MPDLFPDPPDDNQLYMFCPLCGTWSLMDDWECAGCDEDKAYCPECGEETVYRLSNADKTADLVGGDGI